jgi:hypothetical protein
MGATPEEPPPWLADVRLTIWSDVLCVSCPDRITRHVPQNLRIAPNWNTRPFRIDCGCRYDAVP